MAWMAWMLGSLVVAMLLSSPCQGAAQQYAFDTYVSDGVNLVAPVTATGASFQSA